MNSDLKELITKAQLKILDLEHILPWIAEGEHTDNIKHRIQTMQKAVELLKELEEKSIEINYTDFTKQGIKGLADKEQRRAQEEQFEQFMEYIYNEAKKGNYELQFVILAKIFKSTLLELEKRNFEVEVKPTGKAYENKDIGLKPEYRVRISWKD